MIQAELEFRKAEAADCDTIWAIIQQAIANQAHHQYKDQKLFTS